MVSLSADDWMRESLVIKGQSIVKEDNGTRFGKSSIDDEFPSEKESKIG